MRTVVLAIVLMASYAYFYEGGGWNQNTRFDLVRAIVERHTVQIDAYHDNTGDQAHAGGHYYADKAPGASLTAVPPVLIVRAVLGALHVDVASDRTIGALSYVATLAAAAVPATIAAVAVFLVAGRVGASDHAAAIAAVAAGLGSPLWAYATILYGHALAAGCLMLAFAAAAWLDAAPSATARTGLALLVGASAGWAVVTEYPAIIAGAMICVFALLRGFTRDWRALVRLAAVIGVGLAAAAIVLLTYNYLAFGAPFHVGYTSEEGYEAMRTGIFGVNWPTLSTAREILFGSYRGLLPLAPVLALAPVGFFWLVRDRATRSTGLTAGAVALYYFLLTAGYAYWSGGWSYASRHLGPALPFLALGLAPLWQHARAWLRVAVAVLAVVSIGETLVAVATTPQPPAQFQAPMRELLWPAFRSGDFPIGWQSVLDYAPPPGSMSELERAGVARASWNLGQLAGLSGFASLLPLAAVWLVGAGVWELAGKRK